MASINKNLVIAALARDCGKALERNIPLIETLRKEFTWSYVVVIENDSKDNTKEILNKWSNNSDDVKIISNDFGTNTIPEKSWDNPSPGTSVHRIEKMVKYRNMYLNYIKGIKHPIDYVIVIDVDIESFSINGIIKSIKNANSDWGGIFANGITKKDFLGFTFSKILYDIYAICEYPFQEERGLIIRNKLENKDKRGIKKKIQKYNYYSVVSAFGGIGIYKYNLIKELKYCVVPDFSNRNEALCEHIPFNLAIVKLGHKNYLANELSVIYGTHSFGSIISTFLPRNIFEPIYKFYKLIVGSK